MKLRNKIFIGVAALFFVAVSALAITMRYESSCPQVSAAPVDATTMRAVMQRCYGDPNVLRVESIARPVPADDQLLIKVRAASVNPFEWHMTTGRPYIIHLFRGIGAPKRGRLGSDFAGTVEAVGARVTRFKPGDEVFGDAWGALAEYVVAKESDDIVRKPAELTFEEAAAIPMAGITALQGLRDHGHLAAGQKVLINGASGGVGTYAVQIAKSFGAEVTAVCSTRNVALMRSLGADHVIDYTKENFTEGKERYDLIIDNVGNHGLLDLLDAVKPEGTLVGIGGGKTDPWLEPFWGMGKRLVIAPFVDQKMVSFIASENVPDLELLADLARQGKLRTAIDRRYPLEKIGAALDYIGSRHARGKVIVTLD